MADCISLSPQVLEMVMASVENRPTKAMVLKIT